MTDSNRLFDFIVELRNAASPCLWREKKAADLLADQGAYIRELQNQVCALLRRDPDDEALEARDEEIQNLENRLRVALDAVKADTARIAELEAGMREIYEVWAGSDGFIPETAPEGYQQQIIKQMVDIAAKHMKTTRWRPGACQATGIMERIKQSGDRK